jgi:LysM repeat protein
MNNPYDDIGDVERDFWHDEPTRVLRRVPSRAPTASRSRQHLAVIQTPARQNGFSLQRLTTTSDPFVVRMAMMLLLGLFAVLLALAAKRSGSDVFRTAPSIGAVAVPSGAAAVVPVAAVINVPAVPAPAAAQVASAAAAPAPQANRPVAVQTKSAPAIPAQAPSAAAVVAPVAVLPAHPTCVKSYEVVAGDYWIRIAKRAGVTTKQLLAANNATVKTKLFPGRSICLPANATIPTAPATTAAPATTVKPAAPKPAATAAAPATTSAPTTTIVRRSYTTAEVEAIIRQVWPDDLEEEALRIAWRESNLKPTAKNSCCYGLFQINFKPHKSWLAGIGVTSADQLLDPTTNANAALVLYNRAGGWGPWAL